MAPQLRVAVFESGGELRLRFAGYPQQPQRLRADGGRHAGEIQETVLKNGVPESTFRPVRPVPEGGGFFENVWKRYREDKNVY